MNKSVYPTIDDIKILEGRGPWPTKSGGSLDVLFGISFDELQAKYFNYTEGELGDLSQDIKGLRAYVVSGIPIGTIGANEWHKVRNELVFAIGGVVTWVCEDIYGSKREITLDGNNGIWIPPYTLHTYVSHEENSSLLVVANTLFIPDDPLTHDTYSIEDFRKLQTQHKKS